MKFRAIIDRELPPKPWVEGEKIPWGDREFSERMLKEHLSQDHDMASRRQVVIDQHVSWIHESCLHGKSARVLDLACGPGFYAERLARLGHAVVGIDFSPASIAYARSRITDSDLPIDYICWDIRTAKYGEGFDLAMLIFGEFNVFTRNDARLLLEAMYDALNPGGCIVLEPQTYAILEKEGRRPSCWHSETNGLFSVNPHVLLEEHFWHDDVHAATTRYFTIDAATGDVQRFAATTQAYSNEEYDQLLSEAGFGDIQRFPSLTGANDCRQEGLFVLKAKKG